MANMRMPCETARSVPAQPALGARAAANGVQGLRASACASQDLRGPGGGASERSSRAAQRGSTGNLSAGDRNGLAKSLQQLADQGQQRVTTDTLADRARIYGEMLVRCTACHTATRNK
jgi:hypothetical protein